METSISENMQKEYKNFAEMFGCEYQEEMQELINVLVSLAVTDNTYCGKIIQGNGWKCITCSLLSNAVWCNDCFDPIKHEGHNIMVTNNSNGYCDCGDINLVKDTGFCSKHKGKYKSTTEIEHYLDSLFGKEEIDSIQAFLFNLFNAIKPLIVNQSSTIVNDDPENKRLLTQFLSFLIKICNANKVFIFILTPILINQYDYDTTHQCFIITQETIDIMPKETVETVHQCTCPIMLLLINAYKDYVELNEFLLLLQHDYRAEQMIYLSLLCLYDHVIINDNQVIKANLLNMTRPICAMIFKQKTMIDYYTQMLCEMIRRCIKDRKGFKRLLDGLKHWNDLIVYIYLDDHNSLKESQELYNRYIYLICQFHNCFTNNEVNKLTEEDIRDLVAIEKNFLHGISRLSNILIFSFENTAFYQEMINSSLNYFISKFKDKTAYRQLSSSEYSFHIILYRAFAIVITKYVFHDEHINQTNILSLLLKIDYDFTDILREVLKSIGFIYACRQKNWVDIATDLTIINELYHRHATFHDCDCSLLKLFCLLKEYSHLLSFDSLLIATDINDSYESLSKYHALASDKQRLYAEENNLHKEVEYYKDLHNLQTHLLTSSWFAVKVFFKSKIYYVIREKVNSKLFSTSSSIHIWICHYRINHHIIRQTTTFPPDDFFRSIGIQSFPELINTINSGMSNALKNHHLEELTTYYEKRNIVSLIINQIDIGISKIEKIILENSNFLTNAIINHD